MIKGSDRIHDALEKVAGAKRLLRIERALAKAKQTGTYQKVVGLEAAGKRAAGKYQRRVNPNKGKALMRVTRAGLIGNTAAVGARAAGEAAGMSPGLIAATSIAARTAPFAVEGTKALKGAIHRHRYLKGVGATRKMSLSEVARKAVHAGRKPTPARLRRVG
jgi:hypothetical protein